MLIIIPLVLYLSTIIRVTKYPKTNKFMIRFSGGRLIIYLIMLFFSFNALAQDPHFSQFYASPMTLNPAMTGAIPGYIRVAGNFRSQWAAVSTPFYTASAAMDMKILTSRGMQDYDTHNFLGVGLMALTDQSNNGALKANYTSLSVSHNQQLDRLGNYRLSAGLQGTYVNKALDYSKLTFGQQLTPYGYDINLPNGEPRPGFNLNYLDYQAGILFSGRTDERGSMWYIGSSVYHISQPNESTTGQYNPLKHRIVVHGMYNYPVDDLNRVYISALYMKSNFMEERTIGVVYSANIDGLEDENFVGRSVQFGAWYRLKDAIIPYVGLQLNAYKIGLTYDVNVSTLSTASNFRGGFELTMVYNFMDDDNARLLSKMLCPARSHKSYVKWWGY